MLGIVERVEVDGTGPAALKRLHDNLVMRRQELPQLDGLFVYDENGNWIINSTSTPLNRFNNSDREYFIFHRYDSGPGPHIGVPVISRSSGKWVIPVSRRINKPDGSFAGVVLATVDIDSRGFQVVRTFNMRRTVRANLPKIIGGLLRYP